MSVRARCANHQSQLATLPCIKKAVEAECRPKVSAARPWEGRKVAPGPMVVLANRGAERANHCLGRVVQKRDATLGRGGDGEGEAKPFLLQ